MIDHGMIYHAADSSSELILIDESTLELDAYTFCKITTEEYCEFTVPADSYFVMGDNRTNSSDSRNPTVGYIGEDNVYGKVIYKYKNILRNRP